ncbi:hypothetical protein MKX01_028596 [Papaver californicum]|nr:hypothetical protein MKX01_028596 [Papaver californicum]
MKGVGDKERLFYAPISGLGDLLYDKGVEYIDELNDLDEARFKQHSWHVKLLKTIDPIIVSVGWRRYQTRPIYAQEDDGNRLHRIHHIPKHTDFLAMIWGPLAPQDTGLAAFRISAMGVILDFTQAAAEIVAEIVKKRKQVGNPLKIFRKTALIKFTSDHEIDWFEGAAAKKKLVSKLTRKGDQSREGAASCSFQHENFHGDKVFMHVWAQVGEPKDSSDCIGQSMETDDPARSQQTIEQRRAVEFTDRIRRPKECEELSKEQKTRARELSKKFMEESNEIVNGWRNNHYMMIGH